MRLRRSPWVIATWILCTLFAILIAATFTDYGVTWDESVQAFYGELVLKYYASGFSDRSFESFLDLRLYGPAFEIVPALVYSFVPSAKFEIRHLMIAISALLAVIAVYRYKALLDGSRAGFFAALALLFLPQFYGHGFNNSKDIPFACAFAWAMYAIARCATAENAPWRRFFVAGLLIGVALATRMAGIALFGAAFAALVVAAPPQRKKVALQFSFMVITAWTTMTLLWPWAQQNPLLNPFKALHFITAFPQRSPVLFEGAVIFSDHLPRRYLPELLLLTMPVVSALLAVFGAGLVFADSLKDVPKRVDAVLLFCWVVFPIAVFVARPPSVYDGIRHFLFLLPGIATATGGALSRLWRWPSVPARAALAIAALSFVLTGVHMVRLHPYQMTFFNELAGGTGKASKNFDTDYWASSYREAMMWMRDHPCPGTRPTHILVGAKYAAECALAYATAETKVAFLNDPDSDAPQLPSEFDYYLGTTRFGFDRKFAGTAIVHEIGREGAVFSVVRGQPLCAEHYARK